MPEAKTAAFYTKLLAHKLIEEFLAIGITREKATQCAVLCVKKMQQNFDKNYVPCYDDPESKLRSDLEWTKKMQAFDDLINAIKAY